MAIEEKLPEGTSATPERSLPWGGSTVGDAALLAPYQDSWFMFYLTTLARLVKSRVYGVLHTTRAGYTGLLAPTNPAGTTLRMATGAALVGRRLYLNDANIDCDCSLVGYYRLVIRYSLNHGQVRAVLLGPATNGYPSVVRDGYFNDITIARAYSNGATLTLYDDRRFFRNILMPVHSGQSDRWDLPSTPDRVRGTLVQCGSFVPETSPTGVFPRRYPAETFPVATVTTPIVILGAVGSITPTTATKLVNLNYNSSDSFEYYIDNASNLSSIYFISFGMRR